MFRRAFPLCLCLILIRGLARLCLADVWAEDGSIYLQEGILYGWGSLVLPAGGSFHFVQRTIALFTLTCFPVWSWAIVICASTYLLLAAVAATVARPTFAWLIPSENTRLVAAAFLCFLPGLNEMAGNLANINWILFLWLALTLLKDPRDSIRGWEMVVAAAVVFSAGTSILLIPLALWRLWFTKRESLPVLAILVIANAILLGMRWIGPQPQVLGFESLEPPTMEKLIRLGPATFFNHLFRSVVYRPWIGTSLSHHIVENGGKATGLDWPLRIGLLLWFVRWLRERPLKPSLLSLLLLIFSVIFWLPLNWASRPGALEYFHDGGYFHMRYAFPMSAAALLFWFSALSAKRWEIRRGSPILVCLFLFISTTNALERPFFSPYGKARSPGSTSWIQTAARLDQAIRLPRPKEVEVPIFPKGWVIRLGPSQGT